MSDSVHLKERIVFEHQEVCEECFKTDLASLSLLVDAGWKKAGVGGVDGMADHVLFWRPTWQGHGRAREAEDAASPLDILPPLCLPVCTFSSLPPPFILDLSVRSAPA